jgi:hypothetical protein
MTWIKGPETDRFFGDDIMKTLEKTKGTEKTELKLTKTKFLGTLRTTNGNKFNVYDTVGREFVLLFPITPSGKQSEKSTTVKIADLSRKIRQHLGC